MNNLPFLKKSVPHIIAILVIALISIFYFFPQFEGKQVQQGDIISSSQGVAAYQEYEKLNKKIYLWNPGQFGGMPILAGAPNLNNLIVRVVPALQLFFDQPLGLFISGSILCYILFLILGINPWLSLIFSISTVYAAGNVILWEAGHNSKIQTLVYTPLLIAGVLLVFEKKKYLFGFIMLALGFALSLYMRHPQMTYYILLVMAVYGIVKLVEVYKSRSWKHLFTGIGLVAGAVLLGLGTSASRTWSMYEYSKSTMRGEPILAQTAADSSAIGSSSTVKGLDWEYAMQWSNDFKDLMACYIPGFVGGSGAEKISVNSETYKKYRIERAPLYWGQLPFTAGPLYQGAVIIFLFVLGLFLIKGNIKWWLGIGTLLMILLSMGKNAEFLNKLVFDLLPMYNKFRAPQSVLNIAPWFIGILSVIAVQKLIDGRSEWSQAKKKSKQGDIQAGYMKALYWTTGLCAGIALLFVLAGTTLFKFESPADARYLQQGVDIAPFIADRKGLMRADSLRTLLLVLLSAGSIWLFIKNKIGQLTLTGIIGVLILFDVMGVALRYLGHDKFVDNSRYKQNFTERYVDTQIKSLEPAREAYRVFDLSINTFNSSAASQFHNTIGGYDPAKLQRYQDVIDYYISSNRPGVLNMLNTKYYISPGEDGQPQATVNPDALGVAWFVQRIVKANTPNEEINALGRMDTRTAAVVLDSEFNNYVGDFQPAPDAIATVEMTAYEPDKITYKTSTSSEQFVVFSEIWYGPKLGWQAYLDGKPVEHVRANYVLRAMRVPAGDHEIVFEFKPKSYYLGEKISLVSSLVLILLILGSLGLWYREKEIK